MDKEIIKLQNTKAAIKQALVDKGCNPTDEFASYADNIRDIKTGGNEVVFTDENDNQLSEFSPECKAPILVASRLTRTEYDFPNAVVLTCFPTRIADKSMPDIITINIPNCERIVNQPQIPYVKFVTSSKLVDLTDAFRTAGTNSSTRTKSFEITDTSNVKSISSMFYYTGVQLPDKIEMSLPKLENGKLAFNTNYSPYSTVTPNCDIILNDTATPFNGYQMFTDKAIKSISSNTSFKITQGYKMFYNLKLENIPIIDVTHCNNMYYMFSGCTNLKNITFIDNGNILKSGTDLFESCTNLETIDGLNLDNFKDYSSMFYGCKALKYLPEINNKYTINGNTFSNSGLIKIEAFNAVLADNQYIQFSSTLESLRYLVVKNIGNINYAYSAMAKFDGLSNWGIEDESIPLSTGARQSVIDTLITYSVDRTSQEFTSKYSVVYTYNLYLHENTKALLTQDEIAQITSKGYTIA